MARGNILVRVWRYIGTAIGMKFDEMADPKVQLEQAIAEAHEQHRRLKEQAANVIANQKHSEMKLETAMVELEQLNANAQQALLMAEDARSKGDEAKAADYDRAAETIATKLITVEGEVDLLKDLHLQSAQASQQAKDAVAKNATVLQDRLAEKQKLLSQLDQAKMTEQMNEAMSSLNEQVGQDVPTFNEVRSKIEGRLAKAQGRAELEDSSVEARVLEVEHAQKNVQAQQKLEELRSKLGITRAPAPAAQPASAPASASAPVTASAPASESASSSEAQPGTEPPATDEGEQAPQREGG